MDVERIEEIEAAAISDLLRAAPAAAAADLGLRQAVVAGAHCCASAVLASSRELNHVRCVSRAGGDRVNATLDEIDAWYGALGAGYIVGVPPGIGDAPAAELRSRGFTPTRSWAKFMHAPRAEAASAGPDGPAAPVSPVTDLEIGEATGEEFGTVVAAAFGFPAPMVSWLAALPGRTGWTCLVARDRDGSALGSGALFTRDRAAWLGFGGTLPAARGRGAQRALLAARVSIARDAGCDLVTTETGVAVEGAPQQSYRNIERAGFVVAYERPHLASPDFPGSLAG